MSPSPTFLWHLRGMAIWRAIIFWGSWINKFQVNNTFRQEWMDNPTKNIIWRRCWSGMWFMCVLCSKCEGFVEQRHAVFSHTVEHCFWAYSSCSWNLRGVILLARRFLYFNRAMGTSNSARHMTRIRSLLLTHMTLRKSWRGHMAKQPARKKKSFRAKPDRKTDICG